MQVLTNTPVPSHSSNDDLHQLFLAVVLPRLKTHAAVCLRDVRCPHRRDELRSELFALGWAWYVRPVDQGKRPEQFPTAIATFAGRAVKAGRRLCGQDKVNDVLSPLAQRRRGFAVSSLPQFSSLDGNAFDEALHDNTRTPPDEQAAFRCDFPDWVRTRWHRDRRLIDDLMLGERPADLAAKFGLSPGRLSQLRREFFDDWSRFCGERDQYPEERVGTTARSCQGGGATAGLRPVAVPNPSPRRSQPKEPA
jgi:hypothetical protein